MNKNYQTKKSIEIKFKIFELYLFFILYQKRNDVQRLLQPKAQRNKRKVWIYSQINNFLPIESKTTINNM